MDLLEYQAKELFDQMGIPVLPSQRIEHPRDLKGLKIAYPVVLKSQVFTGGRSKAGGIKFVENTIDAIAAAQAIFHLPIMGRYPQLLLAEAKYDADREFYLAIVLDSSTRRPLLLGSQQGGIDVESKLEQMQHVVVEQEFSPYYARRLALKMGLEGELIQAVSAIVEKMYRLFLQQDLDLVEINPLAVSATGELMALDGKIVADDSSLGRRAQIAAMMATIPFETSNPRGRQSADLRRVKLEGNIGLLCNGAGLTMATLDLIHNAKGKPACFVDIGGEYRHNCPPETLQARLTAGLNLVFVDKSVKAILINILGSVISCQQVAETMTQYFQQHPPNLPIVVRLVGDCLPQVVEQLASQNIPVVENLEDAIDKVVILARSAV